MFLDLETFLQHFPPYEMSKAEFADRFTVMYRTPQSLSEIFSLQPPGTGKNRKPIIKDPNTDKRYINRDAIIDYFYEIVITGRHKYLTCFYRAYFEFKDPITLDWNTLDRKSGAGSGMITKPEMFAPYSVVSAQRNDASRRLVRNLFYLELLDKTQITNTVKSHVSFWQSLINMYNNLQLEDRFFAPSSIDQVLKEKRSGKGPNPHAAIASIEDINYNTLFYLFQAYQPKASIFNPYTIKWIMDRLLVPNIKTGTPVGQLSIYTPVLSWSSYLIAFMQSTDFNRYLGVDVMPSVCSKCEFLSNWYLPKLSKASKTPASTRKGNVTDVVPIKKTKFICHPSETLNPEQLVEWNGEGFDCALVCPPYYDMEIYPEGEQSIDTYKDYQSWLDMYWGRTVEISSKVIKKGGVFAFIANNYQSLQGKKVNLTDDLEAYVKRHFTPVDMVYLQNRTSPLRVNAKDRTERLYVYTKL
jgi:hypothetical protein